MSDWQLNSQKGIRGTIEVPETIPSYLRDDGGAAQESPQQAVLSAPDRSEPVRQSDPQNFEEQRTTEYEDQSLSQERNVAHERMEETETLHQRKKRLDEESNFREFRSEYKRLREENDRLLRERYQRDSAPAIQQANDPDEEDVRADDIVEGKHLKKMHHKMRELENRLEQSSIEIRIKTQFPDFDSVVNTRSLALLQESHPELYHTIYSSSDLYNKAASAYTLIKKFNVSPFDNPIRDRALAQNNAVKPRTVTSIAAQTGTSPLSQANAYAHGLTPELQRQLIKEMNEARRGI